MPPACVHRDPTSAAEPAQLLAAPLDAVPTWLGEPMASPRRFDAKALAEMAGRAPSLACECTRHVAEIILQLARFERYSTECATASPTDLALHRHVTGLTGVARTLLEQGLQRLTTQDATQPAHSPTLEA